MLRREEGGEVVQGEVVWHEGEGGDVGARDEVGVWFREETSQGNSGVSIKGKHITFNVLASITVILSSTEWNLSVGLFLFTPVTCDLFTDDHTTWFLNNYILLLLYLFFLVLFYHYC